MADAPELKRARHVYARVLAMVVPVAFSLTVLTFLLYVSGIVEPVVPLKDVQELWTAGAHSALDAAGLEAGFSWMLQWKSADTMCLIALALLASATPVACFAAGIQYLRRREWALGIIALVQMAILGVAMSGLVVAH